MEMPAAARLKTQRYSERRSLRVQSVTTSVSRTTVSVPAGTPNSRTDAKTKVSETVSLAVVEGTLIVNEPVRRVSAARTSHSGPIGFRYSEINDWTTAATPTA